MAPVLDLYRDLSDQVEGLCFADPVTHVYNPLGYAREPAERYLSLAARRRSQVLLLGMNPGPWGMAQTGVPFGTPGIAREWLGIEGAVTKPQNEHPRRPVLGFESQREEVSGSRLWGWVRGRFGTPVRFFDRFFVGNYCPLVFMESSGRNRTPDKLPAREQQHLFEICDGVLRRLVAVLQPCRVVGIGKFAEDRARVALADTGLPIGRILHPSPASPAANRGWAEQAEQQLLALGVVLD